MLPSISNVSLLVPALLGQTAGRSADVSEILPRMMVWLVAIIVIAGILLGILSIVRRKMREDASHAARDFSLGDLRQLHREGRLTAEEFEKAKARLVSAVQSDLAKSKPSGVKERPLGEELKE